MSLFNRELSRELYPVSLEASLEVFVATPETRKKRRTPNPALLVPNATCGFKINRVTQALHESGNKWRFLSCHRKKSNRFYATNVSQS